MVMSPALPVSCQPFPTVLLSARLKSSLKISIVTAEALPTHDNKTTAPNIEDRINTASFSQWIIIRTQWGSARGLTRVNPVCGFDCLLVAGTTVRDLLLRAKYLFVAAIF